MWLSSNITCDYTLKGNMPKRVGRKRKRNEGNEDELIGQLACVCINRRTGVRASSCRNIHPRQHRPERLILTDFRSGFFLPSLLVRLLAIRLLACLPRAPGQDNFRLKLPKIGTSAAAAAPAVRHHAAKCADV